MRAGLSELHSAPYPSRRLRDFPDALRRTSKERLPPVRRLFYAPPLRIRGKTERTMPRAKQAGHAPAFGRVSAQKKSRLRLLPETALLVSLRSQARPTEPNSSIFSRTVSLIASTPGASSFLGSKPLPVRSLPSSIYFLVAAWK